MKKVVVLTGAGMSAESGILTFRDMGGWWQNYRIEEVASPQAWETNRQMVLDFYNIRRKQLYEVEPNAGHYALVELEKKYDVQIVTQNVDDLHERAGSSDVLHLHGELKKVRSERNPDLVYTLDGWELKEGDLAEDGAQLRPHIVWFGESVPMIDMAVRIVKLADILIVIGTSLQVYPAAGLIGYAPSHCLKYYIDPNAAEAALPGVVSVADKATSGTRRVVDELLNRKDD
jgi:NAD-dependent deacetylase